MTELFRLSDPEVILLNASRDGTENPHTHWYVGYAPELEDELDARVVMGTIHAVGETGGADVRVAALLWRGTDAPWDLETLPESLARSGAIETLYDFARVTLRSVLAIVDADGEVPHKSPPAQIDELLRSDASDETVTTD